MPYIFYHIYLFYSVTILRFNNVIIYVEIGEIQSSERYEET